VTSHVATETILSGCDLWSADFAIRQGFPEIGNSLYGDVSAVEVENG